MLHKGKVNMFCVAGKVLQTQAHAARPSKGQAQCL